MKSIIIKRVVAIMGIALVCYLAWAVYRMSRVPGNAYATQGAADLIIHHLQLNSNHWPRSWSELNETYSKLARDYAQIDVNGRIQWPGADGWVASSLEEIHKRIEIDWNVELEILQKTKATNGLRPFRVVWLRDGTHTHWQGMEPNRIIWNYLQNPVPLVPPESPVK